MGCAPSRCCRDHVDYEGFPDVNACHEPFMQMCSPGKDSVNFADTGDEIVLFVNFGDSCSPCKVEDERVELTSPLQRVRAAANGGDTYSQRRYDFEVVIANQVTELVKLHPAVMESKVFKAVTHIPLNQLDTLIDGKPVPVRLPYMTNEHGRDQYREITEKSITDPKYTVYFQSLWNQLKSHYSSTIACESSMMQGVGGYGSMGHTAHPGQDSVDGDNNATDSVDQHAIAFQRQSSSGLPRPQRLWPDSWQMQCWGKCCHGILRSDKPIPKFIAQFFVAPLTNVTGLSLHYQLYLSELFHTTFWTRLGHYLFMPFIVLMMLIFFGQFRFVFDHNDGTNCYKNNNFEVLIYNGTLLLAILFFVWYLLWGVIQKTYLMGVFMTVPLIILVVLANIYFQLAIKNSYNNANLGCNLCWNHTVYCNGHVQYYNIFHFELMEWYYNPVLWAGVFSMFQSMSHLFEPKIPPRVSQTPHWLSCSDMFKRMGYTRTLCTLLAQALFGAVDEFLASPRLLPIFILRVCYELGYQEREWKLMKTLVKECSKYGDPALDYIGVGGALHPSTSSVVFNKNVSIHQLKKEVESMKHALTPRQRKTLTEPALLHMHRQQGYIDPFLQHYVTLRHHVAKYTLQVSAYGPFRTSSSNDDQQAELDNARMDRDFGHNASFVNFLHQVRLGLWKMEDDLLTRRQLSGCCEPQIEEV